MDSPNLSNIGDIDMKNNIPESVTFDDDIDFAILDFEKIRQLTKSAQKKLEQGKSNNTLTAAEVKSIPMYINDMVSYIKKYAQQGKSKLEYDCGALSPICFQELAVQFKQRNPLFYVVQHHHTQLLVVEWSGKNEA
jgi:hypothetical protein